MTISIVTVCYNDLDNLIKTHISIINQSSDLQWVVIDGFSNDGTKEWLESLNMNNLKFLSEPDDGLYDAMNKGINISDGDYLLFLNAGDSFHDDNVIKDFSNYFYKYDLIYGDTICKKNDNNFFTKKSRDVSYIKYGMFALHQSIFFRKKYCLHKYDLNFKIASDYKFLYESLIRVENIKKVDSVVCIFDMNGISNTNWIEGLIENHTIRRTVLLQSLISSYSISLLQFLMNLYRKIF